MKLKVTRQLQVWIEPSEDPDSCRIDKRLPIGYFFDNDGYVIYGHATFPGKGPNGIKFGDGHLGLSSLPAVPNPDLVKDYTEEEIEKFRK